MKTSVLILFLVGFVLTISCDQTKSQSANQAETSVQSSNGPEQEPIAASDKKSSLPGEEGQNSKIGANSKDPKTVMDFFALLPEKYFALEGCFREEDKDCRKARAEYLKNYKEIEDIKNGYLKAGCDGGQRCIEMALFKRPDGSYVVGLATFGEMLDENYFLDYKGGIWTDISAKIVPEYSKDKRYEIPRFGTSVKVFSTKLIEKGDDYEAREKDKMIYDLVWKDGKFLKKE